MPRRNAKGRFVKSSYRGAYRRPRGAAITVREVVSVAKPRRRHHSGGGSLLGLGGGGSWGPVLAPAVAGYAIGKIETSDFWSSVPSLPLLGKKGTVVVAMQVLGFGKAGLLRDIKFGLALLSGYELAKDGVISGAF